MPLTDEDKEVVQTIVNESQTNEVENLRREVTSLQEQLTPDSLARSLDVSYISIKSMTFFLQPLFLILTFLISIAGLIGFLGIKEISDIRKEISDVSKEVDEESIRIKSTVKQAEKTKEKPEETLEKANQDSDNVKNTVRDVEIEVGKVKEAGITVVSRLIDEFSSLEKN